MRSVDTLRQQLLVATSTGAGLIRQELEDMMQGGYMIRQQLEELQSDSACTAPQQTPTLTLANPGAG